VLATRYRDNNEKFTGRCLEYFEYGVIFVVDVCGFLMSFMSHKISIPFDQSFMLARSLLVAAEMNDSPRHYRGAETRPSGRAYLPVLGTEPPRTPSPAKPSSRFKLCVSIFKLTLRRNCYAKRTRMFGEAPASADEY